MGRAEQDALREPVGYDAATPLGDLHTLAPAVRRPAAPPAHPVLVPRGSSRPKWLSAS
ncbi:hypothetical protein [Streptomyces adustus]|uniref:hypothetical protein n=1 Tax=Streptomyces adustus TaxID=1609272 RepID=UPI00371BEAFA